MLSSYLSDCGKLLNYANARTRPARILATSWTDNPSGGGYPDWLMIRFINGLID